MAIAPERYPDHAPGRFYVTEDCLDCDLCRTAVPTCFARNERLGYSYVFKQPETTEERRLCRQSLAECCTEAIRDDGAAADPRG